MNTRKATVALLSVASVLAGCSSLVNSVGRTNLQLYQVDPAFISPSAEDTSSSAGTTSTAATTRTEGSGTKPSKKEQLTNPDGVDKPIDLRIYKMWTCSSSSADSCAPTNAYKAAIADTSGATRNRLKSILIKNSDKICSESQAQLVGANDIINFSFAEITTVLAGSGALVAGLTAAKILSGTAAITNATRTQINEVFYQNALKSAIIQREDSLRVKQGQSIDSSSYQTPAGESQQVQGAQDTAKAATIQSNGDATPASSDQQSPESQIGAAKGQKPAQDKSTSADSGAAGTAASHQMVNSQKAGGTAVSTQRIPSSLASYSTEDMLHDVENYHNMCSFFAGVTGLTQTSSNYTPQDVNALIKAIKDTGNGTGGSSQGGANSNNTAAGADSAAKTKSASPQ